MREWFEQFQREFQRAETARLARVAAQEAAARRVIGAFSSTPPASKPAVWLLQERPDGSKFWDTAREPGCRVIDVMREPNSRQFPLARPRHIDDSV